MKLKTIIVTAMAAFAIAATPMAVSAHEAVLVDTAGIVTDSWDRIDDALWEVNAEHGCNVVVHTTNSLEGMSIASYADEWYESHYGDEDDGVLLVVSMEHREYFILTSGTCIYSFTDAGLDYMEAQIIPDLSDGDYTEAFLTYAELCDDFLVQAATGNPYDGDHMPKGAFDFGFSLLIALGVGVIAGLIGVLFLFLNLKSVHQQSGAADYQKPGSFKLDGKRDLYLYKKVERREKPEDDDHKGGSSTFTSGSGETRGGSGGTF